MMLIYLCISLWYCYPFQLTKAVGIKYCCHQCWIRIYLYLVPAYYVGTCCSLDVIILCGALPVTSGCSASRDLLSRGLRLRRVGCALSLSFKTGNFKTHMYKIFERSSTFENRALKVLRALRAIDTFLRLVARNEKFCFR